MTFPGLRSMGCRKTKPAEVSGGLSWLRLRRLTDRLVFHCATDVDDVVGDDAEPDPTLHSGIAFVAAAIEPVSPLDHADASLASGPPFLSVAEPALPLLSFALGALGRMVGNAVALDALGFRCCLVLRSRMRHLLPPCAANAPALLDASRWRLSAGPNRSDADHRPRSRSRSGPRPPATPPSCRTRSACRPCLCE